MARKKTMRKGIHGFTRFIYPILRPLLTALDEVTARPDWPELRAQGLPVVREALKEATLRNMVPADRRRFTK